MSITLESRALTAPPDQYYESTDLGLNGEEVKGKTYVWFGPHHDTNFNGGDTNLMGRVFPNNSIIRNVKISTKTNKGFDVIYRTNEFSKRVYDNTKNKNEKHLIIAGDSNTFGVGLRDEETIQAVFAKKYPQYNVYNFGHGGGSANNTLVFLENYPWEKNIHESSGKMIYIFYSNWMSQRVVGTKDYLKWDLGFSPWYYLKDDQLVYGGSFRKRKLTTFFRFINFIDRFNWVGDLPKIDKDQFRLIAKMFLKMKEDYLKKFPKGEFTVAVSYSGVLEENLVYTDQLVSWLKELGVNVAKLHVKEKYTDEDRLVDSHFSFQAQQKIERELSGQMKF